MDPLLHELVRAAEKLSSNEHDGGRPVPDFLVLLLCEIDKYTTRWVFYCKKGEDCRAIVGDGDFLQRISRKGKLRRIGTGT